jgi:hypothetical protein
MQVKEVSLAKVIMLGGLVLVIVYSLYLGMKDVALAALGIIGGYLAKDIEINNSNYPEDSDKITSDGEGMDG